MRVREAIGVTRAFFRAWWRAMHSTDKERGRRSGQAGWGHYRVSVEYWPVVIV